MTLTKCIQIRQVLCPNSNDLGKGRRPIKVDLANDCFDPTEYDKNHGKGLVGRVIERLKQTLEENDGEAPWQRIGI